MPTSCAAAAAVRAFVGAASIAFASFAAGGAAAPKVALTSIQPAGRAFEVTGLAASMSDVADYLAQMKGSPSPVLKEVSATSACGRGRVFLFIAVVPRPAGPPQAHGRDVACAIVSGGQPS
jgi:type IV pilus assembly PilN-like protein